MNCWSGFCVPGQKFILKLREDFGNLVLHEILFSDFRLRDASQALSSVP